MTSNVLTQTTHPRCHSPIWICMCGHTHDLSYMFQVSSKFIQGFRSLRVVIWPFALLWLLAFTTAYIIIQTVVTLLLLLLFFYIFFTPGSKDPRGIIIILLLLLTVYQVMPLWKRCKGTERTSCSLERCRQDARMN